MKEERFIFGSHFRGFSLSLADSIALGLKQSKNNTVFRTFGRCHPICGGLEVEGHRGKGQGQVVTPPQDMTSTPKVSTTSPSGATRWGLRLPQIILCVILLIQTIPYISTNFL